jgi:hypothetical protein
MSTGIQEHPEESREFLSSSTSTLVIGPSAFSNTRRFFQEWATPLERFGLLLSAGLIVVVGDFVIGSDHTFIIFEFILFALFV